MESFFLPASFQLDVPDFVTVIKGHVDIRFARLTVIIQQVGLDSGRIQSL